MNNEDGRWVTMNGTHVFIKNKDVNDYMNDKIRGKETQEIDTYNKMLKEVKTFDDFKNVEYNVSKSPEGLLFRTKRAKWIAYDFKENNGKIQYLLSDGISRRENKIDDLYKYLEISDRGR